MDALSYLSKLTGQSPDKVFASLQREASRQRYTPTREELAAYDAEMRAGVAEPQPMTDAELDAMALEYNGGA